MARRDSHTPGTVICSNCNEQSAIVRLTLTTLAGEVLDAAVLCRDCLGGEILDVLTPPATATADGKDGE